MFTALKRLLDIVHTTVWIIAGDKNLKTYAHEIKTAHFGFNAFCIGFLF
jgi:hypothetical protein